VRTLGRELHLRNVAGAARFARDRSRHDARLDSAWTRLARELPERRWRLGRNLRDLRKFGDERNWQKHSVANRMGDHGNLRVRRSKSFEHSTRSAFSVEHTERRRLMGRTGNHGHRISGSVLSEIRHVSAKFPASRARDLRELPHG